VSRRTRAGDDQPALPFGHVARYGPDFLQAPSNAAVLAWLGRAGTWPERRLAIWGPAGSGKTHLAHLWSDQAGATLVAGGDVSGDDVTRPLAIDDAERADEVALLHTLNAAAEARHPVLLTSRAPPARWGVALPDLVSRLRAVTAVELGDPEEALLRALLMRLFAERQFTVPPEVQDWMLARLPRTAAAVREAAARLDAACVRRPPTRAIAATVVAAIEAAGEHDVSTTDQNTVSPVDGIVL
jgi:chromosomal replication initiation ATPase DnaA